MPLMYAPRCLLLPPGWVALGFLLLLGCQALLAHRRQMRRYGAMQLAVSSAKPDTAMARLVIKNYELIYMYLRESDGAKKWHAVDYWGMLLTDADNGLRIKAVVQR